MPAVISLMYRFKEHPGMVNKEKPQKSSHAAE
jgi:hypothetical protein